jgi:pilus assembly protein Flp/PilA
MKELLMRLWREESGQGMAEYGLILALVAIAVIAVLSGIGDNLTKIFGKVKDTLGTAAETSTTPSQ